MIGKKIQKIPSWSPALPLQVTLIGSFDLQFAGRRVDLRVRKGRALLAYLASQDGGSESRERLSHLLWSESAEDLARTSLRQTLRGLRLGLEAVGFHGLAIDNERVSVAGEWVAVDARRVLEDLHVGVVSPLLEERAFTTDDYLRGLDDVDPAFGIWCAVQRDLLWERMKAELGLIMRDGSAASAAQAARVIFRVEPTHEAACREVMRERAGAGDAAAALRAYDTHWTSYDRDFDSEPSLETKELAVAIKLEKLPARDDTGRRPPEPAPLQDRRTILVVSPFDSAGVAEPDLPLVAGFRHELVAKLVRFREWSVFDAFGRELTGEGQSATQRWFSIDATVRQASEGLALTITVKERPIGRYVWSESFLLPARGLVDVQNALVGRIAASLNVHLSPGRVGPAGEATLAPDTYDRWLRGHQLLSSWRLAERDRASELLNAVVAEAPDFAPAYASLVRLYNSEHIVFPGVRRDRVRAEEAFRCATISVRLDPLNSRAHLGLAWSLAMLGQHDRADLAFEDALSLNESDSWTVMSCAHGFAFGGRHDVASDLADRALALDPAPSKAIWGYEVGIRYLCGQFERSVAAAGLADDVISNLPGWKAAALARLERVEEARAEAHRFVARISAAWQTGEAAAEDQIVRWLLDSFPIRFAEDWRALARDLAAAGLPAPDEPSERLETRSGKARAPHRRPRPPTTEI